MLSNETTAAILCRQGRWFPTTHWSVVLAAGKTVSPQSRAALEKLCQAYWYPAYAYLRRCGHAPHDAQDLTQDFFARLLEGNSLEDVSPEKGRFRSFFLAALKYARANEFERANALKRGSGQEIISLDDELAEEQFQREPASALSPEQFFEKQWATALLARGLARLRADYAAERKSALFNQLQPFLASGSAAGEYHAVAAALEMNVNAVAVAVHRLRHRYRELIRLEIAETVAAPDAVEEEMQFLRAVLSR
jgi:RNA polymerase sigma-70 factor (ECF subfamily)